MASSRYVEGATRTVPVSAYERSRAARSACVAAHGRDCAVCGFNFQDVYGEVGAGLVHVHHPVTVDSVGAAYELDPREDLRPVCPNCHVMLHRRAPYSVEELKSKIAEARAKAAARPAP